MANCYVHVSIAAVGACCDCGKYICSNCLEKQGGRLFCSLCARVKASLVSGFQAPVIANPFISMPPSAALWLICGIGLLALAIATANQSISWGGAFLLIVVSGPTFWYFRKLILDYQHLKTDTDYERLLLSIARENNGAISIPLIMAQHNVSPEKIEKYLKALIQKGIIEQKLDYETGRISYICPDFHINK